MGRETPKHGASGSASGGGASKAGALVAGGIGWVLRTAVGLVGTLVTFVASLTMSLAGRACGGKGSDTASHIGELPGHGGHGSGRGATRRRRVKLVLLVVAVVAAGYAFTRWDARELSAVTGGGISDGFDEHHEGGAESDTASPGFVARMTSRVKGLWPFGGGSSSDRSGEDADAAGGGEGGDDDANVRFSSGHAAAVAKHKKEHVGASEFLNPHSLEALTHLEKEAGGGAGGGAGGADQAAAGFGALAAGADPNVARYKSRIRDLEGMVEKLRLKLDKARSCCEAAAK